MLHASATGIRTHLSCIKESAAVHIEQRKNEFHTNAQCLLPLTIINTHDRQFISTKCFNATKILNFMRTFS